MLLTQNEHTDTESVHFAEETCKQNPTLHIASLVVDSLLTNIPLKLLIFAMIVYIKMMRIPLRSLRIFFVICLPWPPKNRFLFLTANS